MNNKLVQKIVAFIVSIFVLSCTSVKRANAHLEKKITAEKLQKDINYVERKLNKLHPSLDLYISKEQLVKKFDSLRMVTKNPLAPNEFYLGISNVVAAVKQGHCRIIPLSKKTSKSQLKVLKKRGEMSFNLLKFRYWNDKLYVTKNFSRDTLIKVGTVIESIDGITPKSLYDKYKSTYASDGYNTTFHPHSFASKFNSIFYLEHPKNDSLKMVFNYKGTINERLLVRNIPKRGKKSQKVIAHNTVVLTKAEKKRIKTENKIFEYDKILKEKNRNLTYVPSDSSIAILKIKQFSGNYYEKAYKSIFSELRKRNTKTLILDLRNNPGGALSEIKTLFSYLSSTPVVFVDSVKVTRRSSLPLNLYRNLTLSKAPLVLASPFLMPFYYFATKKNANGEYYVSISSNKLVSPQPNPYTGKLYVLINGGSFSAAAVLSANLKNIERATFVGEETGGAYQSTVAGILPVLTLPNSKLKFRLGIEDISINNKLKIFGRGVFPDKNIVPSDSDLENGIDTEMNWVLEDIKK
ncbi:MAG: S41 family peptidase [Limnohabitans sp.]|nr:S41 family peptidase [Limnohabitans sp.]